MKTPLLTLFYFFGCFIFYAQEICTTPENNTIDLNIISTKKCDITSNDNDDNSGTRTLTSKTLTARNRIKKVRKTPQKSQSSLQASSKVDLVTTNNDVAIKKTFKSQTKEVLFSVVEQVPLFPKCKNNTNEKAKKCFKSSMQTHFSKNHYPEVFSEEGVKGRILIQFVIDIHGNPQNIQVASAKPSEAITNEIKRIIKKLPQFTAGKEKGIPVNVVYTFPLNLTIH